MKSLSAGHLAAMALIMISATPGMATDEGVAESALIDAGKRHFIRCVACHTMKADAPPMTGPHLEGIVGRRVASVEGFAYTEQLRALDFNWTEEQLDQWLEKPHDLVPGMCMPFMGLRKPEDRKAFIAWLKSGQP
ncbi:c-type cytochrome [Sandaracinobacteroides sp. A072]|uniref:c-type cytochrome n=1 Tax=Sandaracinobacteroides sp. A072 TaxID=3461146 RepID=UPI0040410B60